MALAARHPDRVDRLVLVDLGPGVWRALPNRAVPPPDFADMDEVIAFLRGTSPTTPQEEHRARAHWATKALPNGRLAFRSDPRLPEAWASEDLWAELPRIQAPTLIIRGSLSLHLSDETGRKMARAIPYARFAVVDGAEHSVQVDQAAAFTELVRAFLDEA